MSAQETHAGLQADLTDLVRCRPPVEWGGFAPGGKVKTHQMGTKLSVYRGRGMEFDESRPYQPGDDVRSIDWRLTARTGEMYSKLFHEERERPVQLLIDLRSNMQFGTRRQFKSVLAAGVSARLAWTAIDGGDRVGGELLTPTIARSFPSRRRQSSLFGFFKAIADATALDVEPDAEEIPLSKAIDRLRGICRPGTLVFIISDFHDYDERTELALRRLSTHAQVSNILIYDVLETMLPTSGTDYRISDGAQVMSLDTLDESARQAHSQRFTQRLESVSRFSHQRGMAFHALSTEDDADQILRQRVTRHTAGRRRAAA